MQLQYFFKYNCFLIKIQIAVFINMPIDQYAMEFKWKYYINILMFL